MFLAEPDLIDQIKFEKFKEDDDDLPQAGQSKKDDNKLLEPQTRSPSPTQKRGTGLSLGLLEESFTDSEDKGNKPQLSSKYWDVINKEMVQTGKQKTLPSIKRINHILNIYKAKLDYHDTIPESHSANAKTNLKDKKQSSAPKPRGKDDEQTILPMNPEYVDDVGVEVFSFKRRMQLKVKKHRETQSLEKKEQPQTEKSSVIVTIEPQASIKRPEPRTSSVETPKLRSNVETPKAELVSQPSLRGFSRQSTLKGITLKSTMGVVERLTKSSNKKDEVVIVDGKEFKSMRAWELYNEKQKSTDFEQFKREAVKKIKQTKREFYDRVQNAKPVVPETIKFTKDNTSRLTNLLMPEFDKAVKFNEKEKESIFALDDGATDDRYNNMIDREIIGKMSKLFNGNILHAWKVYQNDMK